MHACKYMCTDHVWAGQKTDVESGFSPAILWDLGTESQRKELHTGASLSWAFSLTVLHWFYNCFFDFIKMNKIWGLSTFTSPIGPSSTQINLLGNTISFQQMCWDHWIQRKILKKPFAIEALGSSVWCPGKCERNEGRSGLCLCFCSPSKT